jgi:hypothetical protein
MDHNDFVFSRGGDGQIYGGGFSVGNILDKFGGGSPLVTLNYNNDNNDNNDNNSQTGGSNKVEQFSDIFKNYVIGNDLYSKLLDLVKEKNIKGVGKKTRRTKIKINKSKKGTQRMPV